MSAALCDTSSRDYRVMVSREILRRRVATYVSEELELVLRVLGDFDIDTRSDRDSSDNLLANEVSDLNLERIGILVLLNVHVDWETAIS